MPVTTMPAIDQDICSGWTENQRNLYNSLPYYLAKMQVDRRKTWSLWNKFVGKRRWTPNEGPIMRAVRTEPSPHIRQFAFPTVMTEIPKKDIMNVREVRVDANVYRHRFESPVLHFYPSFNDFMDHVDDHGTDIMEKIDRFDDIYLRGTIFHCAPYIFICKSNPSDVTLIPSPFWAGTGTFNYTNDGKKTAFILDAINQCSGNLTLAAVNKALTIMENDLRVPFFKGSGTPGGNDEPLQGKYCLVTSSEAFNNFTFDPWLLQAKNCQLDIVNQQFKGMLFGRVTCALEDMPMRNQNDGSWPSPELRVDDAAYNAGESLPSPAYALPENSPWEWGFMVGATGYESIDVGPPPGKFTGDKAPDNFPAMFWNGEVRLTKNFLVPCIDSATGNLVYEMNTYGEHLKFISQASFGCLPKQRRNVIPILYKRKRGA